MNRLNELGWSAFFQEHWTAKDWKSCVPARVMEEHRGSFQLAAEGGLFTGEVSGNLRHHAAARAELPAVGDWVAVHRHSDTAHAVICDVLPRKTKFSRKVAGNQTSEQIVAANVDTIFVVTSLNDELNLRRVERYLTAVWESGSQPVVLLSKADLCDDIAAAVSNVSTVALGVPILVVSAYTGDGLDDVRSYLRVGSTVALLGSSGVGKSTIINRLLGTDVQSVLPIREHDDRGRHATTSRRLFVLPMGGLLLDTPGMRELQLWDAESGFEDAFPDINALAQSCRFRDCRHETEPHCAVRDALHSGELDAGRYESYSKLKKELAYLARKQDSLERIAALKRMKKITLAMRRHYKLNE